MPHEALDLDRDSDSTHMMALQSDPSGGELASPKQRPKSAKGRRRDLLEAVSLDSDSSGERDPDSMDMSGFRIEREPTVFDLRPKSAKCRRRPCASSHDSALSENTAEQTRPKSSKGRRRHQTGSLTEEKENSRNGAQNPPPKQERPKSAWKSRMRRPRFSSLDLDSDLDLDLETLDLNNDRDGSLLSQRSADDAAITTTVLYSSAWDEGCLGNSAHTAPGCHGNGLVTGVPARASYQQSASLHLRKQHARDSNNSSCFSDSSSSDSENSGGTGRNNPSPEMLGSTPPDKNHVTGVHIDKTMSRQSHAAERVLERCRRRSLPDRSQQQHYLPGLVSSKGSSGSSSRNRPVMPRKLKPLFPRADTPVELGESPRERTFRIDRESSESPHKELGQGQGHQGQGQRHIFTAPQSVERNRNKSARKLLPIKVEPDDEHMIEAGSGQLGPAGKNSLGSRENSLVRSHSEKHRKHKLEPLLENERPRLGSFSSGDGGTMPKGGLQ